VSFVCLVHSLQRKLFLDLPYPAFIIFLNQVSFAIFSILYLFIMGFFPMACSLLCRAGNWIFTELSPESITVSDPGGP
jgi:hypothetical protein